MKHTHPIVLSLLVLILLTTPMRAALRALEPLNAAETASELSNLDDATNKDPAPNTPLAQLQSLNSGQHFFPPFGNERDRFGFVVNDTLSGYDVAQLHAGWYDDRQANLTPPHPDGLASVQLVRFQAGADPYDPAQVSITPPLETIAQIATAHPGSLWFMGINPDSVYIGNPILPQVYAVVYHDLYAYIKELDPAALVANGAIVQPTPCRLAYLDIVWETYLDTFGAALPVDVWNIHAYILREVYNSWGASTPPGVDRNCAMDYTLEQADDVDIFLNNVRVMREWMKDKGYQDRPLTISEYGVLWPEWYAPQFTPLRVSQFMTRTFDLLLYESDPDIGYPADDDRLVQAWSWYSLSDDQQYNGYLFRSANQTLSLMGYTYATYTGALSDTLYSDLSVRLVAYPAPAPSLSISLTANVDNLGKLPATGARTRLKIVSAQGLTIFSQDEVHDVPSRFGGGVALSTLTTTLPAPDLYILNLVVDPQNEIAESREWNNAAWAVVDLRPGSHSLTLSGLFKNADGFSSRYVITNTGSHKAVAFQAFYDHWGSLVISQTSAIPAAESHTYNLAALAELPDGYRGYVTVSADQPITGTVFNSPSVAISGPTVGMTDTAYAFTATVASLPGILPITYTWQATGQSPLMHMRDDLSDVVTWTWDAPGPQVITVTARHDDYIITDTHLITSYIPHLPTVDWVADLTAGFYPLTVVFTATETDTLPFDPLLAYLWRFGDGETSASPSPTHIYTATGSYTVTLTVSNTAGNDTLTRANYITVYEPVQAGFMAAPRQGFAPLTVHLTSTSSGPVAAGEWAWGDGETSALEYPSHTYTTPGTYTVSLAVRATAGSAAWPGGIDILTRTHYVTVYEPVKADFLAAPRYGIAPLTIYLTSTSSGPVAAGQWAWGDGEASALEHTTHTYTTPGTYTLSLTVRATAGSAAWPGGTDILTRTNYVTVYEPVQASFTVQPTWGYAPLRVVFDNTSSGDYTASLWSFGDGMSSTLHSPIYTYTAAGTYTLGLAVHGPGGSDTETRYITVYQRVYLPLISRY